MKQFTAEQIKQSFEKLPKSMQLAITSTEIVTSMKDISERHGLHIDQLGELIDLIGLVLIGLVPSKDFVKNFSKEARVSEDIAREIAKEINSEVFEKLLAIMHHNSEEKPEVNNGYTKPVAITAVEDAGNFSVDASFAGTHGNVPIDNKEKNGWIKKMPEPTLDTEKEAPIQQFSRPNNNDNPSVPNYSEPIPEPPANLPIEDDGEMIGSAEPLQVPNIPEPPVVETVMTRHKVPPTYALNREVPPAYAQPQAPVPPVMLQQMPIPPQPQVSPRFSQPSQTIRPETKSNPRPIGHDPYKESIE